MGAQAYYQMSYSRWSKSFSRKVAALRDDSTKSFCLRIYGRGINSRRSLPVRVDIDDPSGDKALAWVPTSLVLEFSSTFVYTHQSMSWIEYL